MKPFTSFLLAASLVAAQDYSGQPKCAIPCLNEAIPKVGCSLTDTSCQCDKDKQNMLTGIVAPCLLKSCPASDLLKAQSTASAACAAFASTAGSGFISTALVSGGSSASLPTGELTPPVQSTKTTTGSASTPTAGGSSTSSGESTTTSFSGSSATETPSSSEGSTTGTAAATGATSTSSGGAAALVTQAALLVAAAALAL